MNTKPTPATTQPAPASEADVQDFANMSAALTGFLSSVLKPKLDPVGLARTYYEFALAQIKASQMSALLNAFRAIQTQPPQTIADTLLETSSPTPSDQALIAQSIIAMWYLGAWYRPGAKGGGGFPPTPLQIISSEAYTNGLVWSVMQSHPMGFSPFTFGYWSQAPGPLSSFGVNTGKGGGQ
jgi:hypothetical protein